MSRSARFKYGAAAMLVSVGLYAPFAHANGSFPKVSQFVVDPSDDQHLVLRSNFGLLVTRDRGSTWDLLCEAGMGYQNTQPPVAILGDGSLIIGLSTGVAWADPTGCNFSAGTGISMYVADVSRIPGTVNHGIAVTADVSGSSSQLFESDDGGKSWSKRGVALAGVIAATLDTPASDTSVTYVTGSARTENPPGVLLRSVDGGKTWDRHNVPQTNSGSSPYIAAIAADDANTVYVRTSGVPGHLLVTHDGGKTFLNALDFAGPVEGVALSSDGKFVYASGRIDGVHRAPTKTLAFETLSCAKVSSLAVSGSQLFSCANEAEAGYTVGSSTDSGQTFAAKLHLSCVRGIVACPAGSSVGSTCPAAWPQISNQLGGDCSSAGSFTPSTECVSAMDAGGLDAAPPDSGTADATAMPPKDAATVTPMTDGGAGALTVDQPHPTAPGKSGGCGCSTVPSEHSFGAWLSALGLIFGAAQRRRRAKQRRA